MARMQYLFEQPVPMQLMMPDGTTIRELAYSTADARLAAICHGADAEPAWRSPQRRCGPPGIWARQEKTMGAGDNRLPCGRCALLRARREAGRNGRGK